MCEPVRLAQRRGGRWKWLDVLVILSGNAIRETCTLEAFDEPLHPLVIPFLPFFERGPVPARSTLSCVFAAHSLSCLMVNCLARSLTPDTHTGGLVDRAANHPGGVCAIDGWDA